MTFEQFLTDKLIAEDVPTDDVLSSFLPLLREVIETHRHGLVAPLVGTQDLHVEGIRLWFEEAKRQSPRSQAVDIARLELAAQASVEVLSETRRTTEVDDGSEFIVHTEIGTRGDPITRPVYLPGYVTWEHELGHHDPLTDALSLGLILASVACGLNLNEPADLEAFVTNRRNLFALNPQLHPVIAQAILRLTELDRRRRPQDLPGLLRMLENYREQPVDFEIDLARMPGFQTRDRQTRHAVVLSKLKERLFDISRRNNLLHFRPTLQSVNLTHSSIPLTLDVRNIRQDQILVWNQQLQAQIVAGKSISLNKHLNFAEALYLPSILDRILADARRDNQEFGFAQLRLVACLLSWTNIKETPVERYISPLVLIPVRLTKNKGIRDTFSLEALSSEAELNPIVRHQFQQLYNIELPETIDLAETSLDALFDYLTGKIQASEPAITLTKVDRPRIDLVHEKAKRRLDQYRRSARVSGRGVRTIFDLDYSYDLANYHPLGIKLFSAFVRTPGSHLRDIVETKPRPREFAAPNPADALSEKEKSFYHVRDATEENPYLWNFDLCSLTLANLRYRRMSLVRDYDAILNQQLANPAFETTFSLTPRPIGRELPTVPSLDERFDVVPCDPTQATAIAEARRGESYIIQGPPGTGKSQTITNLIADFVARGKRVLFVCEKRAAIDVVFARLKQCGLGPLCSLIHDSQTDKKEFILDLKQTYELFTTDSSPAGSAPSRTTLLRKLQSNLQPLAKFEELMEGEATLAGLPLRRFLDQCVRLAASRPEMTPELAERLPTYQLWWSHREQLASLDVSLRDLEPSGILARHPLRRLKPELAAEDRPMETVRARIQEADEHLQRLTKSLGQCGIPADQWNSLRRAGELIEHMQQIAPLSHHGNLALADPASERAREFEKALSQIKPLEAKLVAAQNGTTKWRHKLSADDVRTGLEQARAWQGKFFCWLSPAWWRLRKVLNDAYDFKSHAVRPTWTQVLQALADEHAAQAELDQFIATTTTAFGGEHDPSRLRQELDSLRDRLPKLPDWLRRIHAALLRSPNAESIVERTLVATDPLNGCRTDLEAVIADFDDLPLEKLKAELAAIRSALRQIPQALSLLKDFDGVPAEIGRTLRELPWDMQQAESAIAQRTWEQLTRDDRDLGRFDGRSRQRNIRRLESLYDDCLTANAEEVCRRVRDRFREHLQITNLTASQLTPEQKEFKKSYQQGRRTLEHEFGKSMRYKAIRELVDGDAGQVIRDLKPVWLMSPLSVSDTLPLAIDFVDVVIFDEASQVPLEEAVPSLFRGQQVIVVGDEMQLPPTDFFAAKRADDEDDDLLAEADYENVQYELSSNSFLNHAAKNLPATMLGWHYRSRSESLISFSNWAFYDGLLLTVPEHRRLATEPAANSSLAANANPTDLLLSRPISFHQLPGGTYDKRRNRAEADHIAHLVSNLLKKQQGLSIGVIAFSEAQQDEINVALNRLASEDDEFRRLLDEELQREVDGQFVGLLVKNLENIQGDERDVIILSICYGKGPNGKMLMNFGPINKSGGEKRLNVAFSRAKHHMAIVSTIRYSEITNEYNEGANCLRNYLRYAEAMSGGDVAAGQRVLAGVTRWKDQIAHSHSDGEDAVVEQLAACLRERGYVVELGLGQSHFHVDLAIRLPEDGQYRLGILVDTPIQYEQAEPLERDVMRPRLLRTFGWKVESVLAKDWYENREQEIARLISGLQGVKRAATVAGPDDDSIGDGEDLHDEVDLDSVDVAESQFVDDLDIRSNSTKDDAIQPRGQLGSPSIETAHLVPSPPASAGSSPRRFEFRDGKSSKFWEIIVSDQEHTVRFGRIGSAGQSQTKAFPSNADARRDAERLITEKQRKGYDEVVS
jgi:predicted DNA-binding WGR domain protein